MTILFLHGWNSVPGGVKPTYLRNHGHEVINPALPHEDFAEAVRIAQAEFDKHQPPGIVGSSRGGAVTMNMNSGDAKLVLLCPAWKKYGMAKTVKPGTVILHSRADDVVPFADSEELARNSGAALIEVGSDHRLAAPEPLEMMLAACERKSKANQLEWDKQHEWAEYGVVRVAHLLRSDRQFQGTPGVCRAPQIGDIGTIVFAYDLTSFAVECVNPDGMTVWLADFFCKELEFLGEGNFGSGKPRLDDCD
ncbi:MAG: alpha/beta fold hydrolase [Pirellulales bacterium]